MQILVIAATEMEIKPFLTTDPPVDVLIAGVGAPATIYNLVKKLQTKSYELVIQAGIGGTFSIEEHGLGKVVIIEKDVFGDLGIEEKKSFYTLFELGFANGNDLPFKNGWLQNEFAFLDKLRLKKVNAVTVNKVSDEPAQTEIFKQKFSPAVESMEGAAFHFVCIRESIPFIQLRSISNAVGERDKTKWKMKEAIVNLNEALTAIVNGILNAS